MKRSALLDKAALSERHRRFIVDAFDKWAAGGTGFFTEVLAPHVRWTIKGTGGFAGTYSGRDEFMRTVVAPFSSRLSTPIRPSVRKVWADGDDVAVYWDGAAVAKDGVPYHNSYVWVFRIEDGQAVEVVAFLDLVPFQDVIERIAS
jgi:ketosteroid isomerase-like protein